MGILKERVKAVWDEAKAKGKMIKKDGRFQLQYDVKGTYDKAMVVVEGYYKKEDGPKVCARRLRQVERMAK